MHFYPRPPGGGRREQIVNDLLTNYISIHALRVEGDEREALELHRDTQISIHALRVEGDNYVFHADMTHCDFYPRHPGGGRLRF